MKAKFLIPCVLGSLALFAIYILPLLSMPSNQSLLTTALTASSEKERVFAAQQLCERNSSALTEIRQLTQESESDDIVSLGLLSMARNLDYDGIDIAFTKLESSSTNVRQIAARAIAVFLGVDHRFPATGSPDERRNVSQKMREEWERYKKSKLFQVNQERNKFNK